MSSNISRYVVLLLICMVSVSQSEVQGVPPSGKGILQNPINNVDPHAVALIQQLDSTYKSMQSYAADYEEGSISKEGNIAISCHTQFAYRRPDHLALATGSTAEHLIGPSKVFTDGKHVYLMIGSKPRTYSELRDHSSSESPFSIMERLPYIQGVLWLHSLLEGNGLEGGHPGWELRSLSAIQSTFEGGVPVDVITARWLSAKEASQEWEIRTYTIGSRDHLLYQASIQTSSDTSIHIARYLHSQPDAILPDNLFTRPPDATRLPHLCVVTVDDLTITLDKGSIDGVSAGDFLMVYPTEKLGTCNASLLVTKTQAHTCKAKVLSNTLGVFPGEVCIIGNHQVNPKGKKRKSANNTWLWPPERQ
ncbi:MAG: hypothetical protein JWL77_1062 [Chthonomonadaceae bacterium]|nr:hypothetical protein [Chthonomonadaceae bacterium]